MIIKKMKAGKGFRGVLAYCLNDKEGGPDNRAEIIGGNMAGTTPQALASEFGLLRKLNPKIASPVRHIAIRLSPQDEGLTEKEWRRLGNIYLKTMGYDSYALMVLHKDSHPPHLHIVTSNIKFNGRVVNEWQDIRKGMAFAREAEKEFGLVQLSSKPTGNQKLYWPRQRQACRVDHAIQEQQQQKTWDKLKAALEKPQQQKADKPKASTVVKDQAPSSRALEALAKQEGQLLAQLKSLQAVLGMVKGTAQEQDIQRQLAEIEKQLAAIRMQKQQAEIEAAEARANNNKNKRRFGYGK